MAKFDFAKNKEIAEKLCEKYNEAILSGKFKEAHDLNEKLTALVNEYTANARMEAIEKCAKTEDPMMTAIVSGKYATIAINDTKEGELKIPTRSIVERTKRVGLVDLHKRRKGIGKDTSWYCLVQRFNMELTVRLASKLDRGDDSEPLERTLKKISDSFKMDKLAKEISLGENPVSDENLTATIKKVVTAMIGEEYAKDIDERTVNYILNTHTKASKQECKVACARNTAFADSVMLNVCLHCIKGIPYGVEYQEEKQG